MKDGLLFSSKYASGQIMLMPPTVIIFANQEPPAAFVNNLSADRMRVVNLRKTRVYENKFVLPTSAFTLECAAILSASPCQSGVCAWPQIALTLRLMRWLLQWRPLMARPGYI